MRRRPSMSNGLAAFRKGVDHTEVWDDVARRRRTCARDQTQRSVLMDAILRARSAMETAFILRMMLPRWIFTAVSPIASL